MIDFLRACCVRHYRFPLCPRAFGMDVRVAAFLGMVVGLQVLTVTIALLAGQMGMAAYGLWVANIVLLTPFHVLAHELGHVAVARCFGWKARATVLHVLGGSTEFTGPVPSCGREILIALAGPLTSGGLAFAGWITAPWTDAGGWAVRITIDYLVGFHFMLALFNLLPMYLLDGGRVALAAFVKARGPEVGTRWAEHAAFAGLVVGVAWLATWGSWVGVACVALLYVGGRRMLEERRQMAWALFRADHPALSPSAFGAMVTGGALFFGTGRLDGAYDSGDDAFERAYQARVARPANDAEGRRWMPGWWRRWRAGRRARRMGREREEASRWVTDEDRLLKKIADEGIGALTPEEYETLRAAAEHRKSQRPPPPSVPSK